MNGDKAYLSNDKDMIKFQYGDKIIRFRGAYSLERFTAVKEWDNGYLVVMAKYRHRNLLKKSGWLMKKIEESVGKVMKL